MKHRDERPRIRFVLLGGILVFLILAVPPTWADEDYVLTGIYELTGSTDVGEEVLVTIEVRIFNRGDLAAYNITGALQDPILLGTNYGAFSSSQLRAQESVRMGGTFHIPERMYYEWETGLLPKMSIAFVGADGILHRGLIPLLPMPVGRED